MMMHWADGVLRMGGNTGLAVFCPMDGKKGERMNV